MTAPRRRSTRAVRLRTILFWTHLTAGLVAGIVILIMSVTGTLLTFQQSVLKTVERSQRYVEPPEPGASRLDIDVLLERVRAAVPDAEPTTVTLDSDPRVSASVALGQRGTAFVNPCTGEVLGTGSARARAFYRSVTSWHRYLSVEGEHRATARAITGACNAAFLVLAITGLYLWWPRHWTWPHCVGGNAVSLGDPRQGSGLQLAQRHRVLVRADPRRSHRHRDGHLLQLGQQPGLYAHRQSETRRGSGTRRRPGRRGRRRTWEWTKWRARARRVRARRSGRPGSR